MGMGRGSREQHTDGHLAVSRCSEKDTSSAEDILYGRTPARQMEETAPIEPENPGIAEDLIFKTLRSMTTWMNFAGTMALSPEYALKSSDSNCSWKNMSVSQLDELYQSMESAGYLEVSKFPDRYGKRWKMTRLGVETLATASPTTVIDWAGRYDHPPRG